MNLTLAELAAWCGGKIEPPEAALLKVSGVSTDTRTICPGELFIAIDGLNQDGHRFVKYAATSGAAAALVQKPVADANGLPLVVVQDSLTALGQMANGYRWHPPLIPWIAVSGSNGKTTTREILSLILSSKWKVRTSKRN
ncbi:MAG: Mur ligase domain-containing protein, partial [Planctomycetes bacterium]|nr:Mur ligase domain-containing protein [Planctomycetota bacterium]